MRGHVHGGGKRRQAVNWTAVFGREQDMTFPLPPRYRPAPLIGKRIGAPESLPIPAGAHQKAWRLHQTAVITRLGREEGFENGVAGRDSRVGA